MIGKAEWFKIRKYGGWGIAPANKNGWWYIAGITLPIIIFQSLPWWSDSLRSVVMAIWLGIILIDVLDIMVRLKKDEREVLHEAIAERNAAWWMVTVIAVGFLISTIGKAMEGEVYFDPILITALLGAALIKSLTHWRLRNK